MPTYSQCWAALKAAIWIIHQDYLELKGNSEQYIDHQTDVTAALAPFDIPYRQAAIRAIRAYRGRRVNGLFQARAMLDPLVAQFSRAINCPETDPGSVILRLADYMVSVSDTIKTDSGTYGTASAITGTGNPDILRLTTDRYGYAMETGRFNETKTFTVDRDQASGVDPGSEEFVWRGDNVGVDLLDEDGSGFNGRIGVSSGNQGSSVLQNSSFGDLDGTVSSLTSIPGWDVTDEANFQLSTTTYRQANYETTAYSLQFDATDTASQSFSTTGIQVTDPDDTPWAFAFRWNRNSQTGTLSHALGASSQTVSVVAQSGWQLAYMDLDKDLFYRGWKQDAPKVSIGWDGSAGFLVDDVYLGPMTRIGPRGRHTWMTILAGSTDLLRDAYFTAADTRNRTGIIQRWLIDLYGLYLPHDASSPTIADPT